MPFDHIAELRKTYTDKYVVVDAAQPELARFAGQTGQVKTINMSGRALVQFAGDNIGRYDIELDFLTVVDKPAPPPEPVKKAAAKSTAATKPAAETPKSSAIPTAEKTSPGDTP